MSNSIVTELSFARSSVARPLFESAAFDRTFVDAYFEGKQAGRLFVDDSDRPSGALLCRTYDYFLAAEPVESLRRFILEAPAEAGVFDVIHDLHAARRKQTIALYGLVPLNTFWRDALVEDHGGRLEAIGRRSFRYPPASAARARGWRDRVPAGFRVREIDGALAERIDEDLGDVIGLLWGGYERFGARGFGACAMKGNEIASVAYTSALSDREINIGVDTAPAFRRLGLASTVSHACIARALDGGLVPTWDCDAENIASAALAEHIGFTEFPSFVELAFPNRGGPEMSTDFWSNESTSDGIIWRRNNQ